MRAAKLVNETISTLLLNYVAPLIVSYFIFGPWRSAESASYPQSPAFVAGGAAAELTSARASISGLFFGLAGLALYGFAMARTRWGLEMRAIGGNAEASLRLGVPVSRLHDRLAMTLAGGIAGIAGMAKSRRSKGGWLRQLSPGYGFMGFLVAWLAGGRRGRHPGHGRSCSRSSVRSATFCRSPRACRYAVINLLMAVILFIVLGAAQSDRGAR